MAKVTDKNYYKDDFMVDFLDGVKKRIEKEYDAVLLYTGPVGAGKSTKAVSDLYYLSEILDRNFNVEDNIFFDIEELVEKASNTEEQIFLWDEAALGGMATEWQSNWQKKLIKLLLTARKKKHVIAMIIPRVKLLKEDIMDRAICLMKVFPDEDLNRGPYDFYNKEQKEIIYSISKKRYKDNPYEKVKPYHKGNFVNVGPEGFDVIDWEKYEEKKDKAIERLSDDDKDVNQTEIRIKDRIVSRLKPETDLTQKKLAELMGVSTSALKKWKKLEEKYDWLADEPDDIRIDAAI